MVIVAGVMSWEVQALKKLPAVAVMVGMSDAVAQSVLAIVARACYAAMVFFWKVRGQRLGHALRRASLYSSCSVVDKFVWHHKENEPAEGMFIAQLGCRGSVCGIQEITMCVCLHAARTRASVIACASRLR